VVVLIDGLKTIQFCLSSDILVVYGAWAFGCFKGYIYIYIYIYIHTYIKRGYPIEMRTFSYSLNYKSWKFIWNVKI
jgi:hypothetical protein